MKLVKLELFGFKSFVDRTVFHFSDGITVIVGPNGSGKSNIVDAVIWTLGERGTRALRIKEMQDVIFHGSDGRRGVNIAEVTMFFEDKDKEYSVRRRTFRDGTNEYFLNGKAVRLKDIQDFFLGSGIGPNTYAIIEQGKVENFVQMKPTERRVLIEEAGGITRFKEKKEEAISRLAEVQMNLERLQDVYREVLISYEKAKTEWERWKKYVELSKKKREVERDILLHGFERIRRNFERLKEKVEKKEEELERKKEEEAFLEKSLFVKEEKISLGEKTQKEIELSLRTKEKDLEVQSREIDRKKNEILELSKRMEDVQDKLKKTRGKIEQLQEEIESLSLEEKELTLKEHEISVSINDLRDSLKMLKKELDEIEALLEEKRTELFLTVSELTEVQNAIREIERKEKEKKERERRFKEEKELCQKRMASLRDENSSLLATIQEKTNEVAKIEQKLSSKQEKISGLKEKIDEIKKVIDSLKIEKNLKEEHLRKLFGLEYEREDESSLKRLINVVKIGPQGERSLERFFGRELESYVIEEKEPEAIANSVRNGQNYIFFAEKGIFRKMEDGVVINFTEAKSLREAIGRVFEGEEGIFVTEDGLVDSRGLIITGSKGENLSLLAEKEKKRFRKEIRDLEEKIRTYVNELDDLDREWKDLVEEEKLLKEKRDREKKEIESLENKLWSSERMLKELGERIKKLSEEMDVNEDGVLDKDSYFELKKKEETLLKRKMQLESEMINLKSAFIEKRKSFELLSEELKKMEIERERKKGMVSRIGGEKENRKNELGELHKTEKAFSLEIEDIKRRVSLESELLEGMKKDLQLMREECVLKEKKNSEIKSELDILRKEKEEILKQIREKRREIESAVDRLETQKKELFLLSEKMEEIATLLKTAYEIDPQLVELPKRTALELEEERSSLEKEIERLGDINFRADKEYHELKERVEFLQRQKVDLEYSMESLKRTISKIDSLSNEIFFETLDMVNLSYKKFISRLFSGGEGYLRYNPETHGVEMFAQPPGKRITRIEMLSGGEKALASIALLLALVEVNPPPFCFMDEIDAPLDDANIKSLLEIIEGLSKKTQIILITHNRLTMEVSNTIYGLTMEDEGISKVVSVRLN